MSTVTHATAKAMKDAGFPQEAKVGQIWYSGEGYLCCVLQTSNPKPYNHRLKPVLGDPVFGIWQGSAFAPTLDDIFPYLPDETALEMWGSQHSCSSYYQDDHFRTFGESFAEAAAKMWLHLNTFEYYPK
jgi:hypothetical protein